MSFKMKDNRWSAQQLQSERKKLKSSYVMLRNALSRSRQTEAI
jgi:hypothetical protein